MKPTLNDHTLTSVWRGALTPTMPHSSLSAAADATGAEPTLDAQNLEYISSAGLRVLLSAQKRMNRQGDMVVRNVSETVREVFDMTGFSDFLTIE